MPIGSLEEFEATDNQLKNDELKDLLVHELRRHFVFNSERDTIFQIMPEVFGIEFAITCSYKGQKDNFKVDCTAVLSTIKVYELHELDRYMRYIKECFWPPLKGAKLKEAIIKQSTPQNTWTKYKIRLLKCYDEFKVASKKCELAKEQESLSSCSEAFSL
ncbi:hypothetical protein RN001_014630 [Aquatica leii]|uniref:Uncharacterized protein n=1 Tax=Aquatica leii TaxID=1421715 RepID=A0AAN7P263_9COLE|nr:hypothetical protein RN001_014630 [Aquatica leii]